MSDPTANPSTANIFTSANPDGELRGAGVVVTAETMVEVAGSGFGTTVRAGAGDTTCRWAGWTRTGGIWRETGDFARTAARDADGRVREAVRASVVGIGELPLNEALNANVDISKQKVIRRLSDSGSEAVRSGSLGKRRIYCHNCRYGESSFGRPPHARMR